jgi:hypothetical protein
MITTLVAPTVCRGSTADAPSGEVRLARELNAPSDGVRLAQELNAPTGEVRLTQGLNAPSGEVCLARGLNAPSARSASLEGSTPPRRGPPRSRAQCPLGEDRLAQGHLHACRSRTCPYVRAFNALTPQDARHDPETPGNHAPALFHRLPGKAIPTTV